MPATTTDARNSARNISLDDQDESVRIAVRALGDMRAGAGPQVTTINTSLQPTPALSTASAVTSPSISTPTTSDQSCIPPDYLSRVSGLPLVSGALRAYEQGKASSRVVKYGAEMMESSISTISRPVIDRLGIGSRSPAQTTPSSSSSSHIVERGRTSDAWESDARSRDSSVASSTDPSNNVSRSRADAWVLEERRMSHDRSRTPQPTPATELVQPPPQEVAQRSRWQTMLLEAGGISAAISDDNMRRLKYCLQCLQYATEHIDAQILVLRDFIASLQPDSPVSPAHLRTLHDVKRDVVATVRQAVSVVSKYAGGALPEPARNTVRGFILHLPQRWARAAAPVLAPPHRAYAHPPEHTVGATSTSSSSSSSSRRSSHAPLPYSRPASPTGTSPVSPRSARTAGAASASAAQQPDASATTQAAQRILTLATESLDMMRGVTGVVRDSLDRADMWVERLRMVGIQRQQQPQPQQPSNGEVAGDNEDLQPLSPAYSRERTNGAPSLVSSSADSPVSSRPTTPTSMGDPSVSFRAMTLHSRYTSPLVENVALPPTVKEELRMEVDV